MTIIYKNSIRYIVMLMSLMLTTSAFSQNAVIKRQAQTKSTIVVKDKKYRQKKTIDRNSAKQAQSTSSQIKPIEQTNKKNIINGHEWVDLGLSVKWAICNVGANKPEDYGDYFAWGEVEAKNNYIWNTYKWCKGSENSMNKYCNNKTYGNIDNKSVIESSDDVAHVSWGSQWRIPTNAELEELHKNCIWKWTILNGVKGYKISSRKNRNYIFLPAAGCRYSKILDGVGIFGYYWSNSSDVSKSYCAYGFYYGEDKVNVETYERDIGLSVRPVCP